jgi:hypothetical protein
LLTNDLLIVKSIVMSTPQIAKIIRMKPGSTETQLDRPVTTEQRSVIGPRQAIRSCCKASALPERESKLLEMYHFTASPNSAA